MTILRSFLAHPSRRPLVRPGKKRLLHLERLEDRTNPSASYVPDELLVQFAPSASSADRAKVIEAVGATLTQSIYTAAMRTAGQGYLEVVHLPTGLSVADGAARFALQPKVVFAEPNYVLHTDAVSNDPEYTKGSNNLWGMYGNDKPSPCGPAGTTNDFGSQAEKAWDKDFVGSNSVYIGVIDEGFQFAHPDLAANSWTNPFDPADGIDNDGNGYIDDIHGWDFKNNDNSTYDGTTDDHGTHVAGSIGAVGGNGEGVVGVTWKVTMISGKFLEDSGQTSDAILAIDYMTDLKQRHGINLVATNNSWGGGGDSTALHEAINRMAKAGILFVAAAGNDGTDNDSAPHYPSNYSTLVAAGSETAASYEAIVSVGSIDNDGNLSGFSNFGVVSVDLAAPGGGILSTLPEGTYGTKSGTSMAAPHVTGAIALYSAAYPIAKPQEIRDTLLQSTAALPSLAGKVVSGGALDVGQMLSEPPGPAITFVELAVSPNPIGFGEAGLLRATFLDVADPKGPHFVTINWGDGTADTSFSLAAGKNSFTSQHTYFGTGATATTVTVTDLVGGTGTGTVTINMDSKPPTASITGIPKTVVDEGKKITLGSFVKSANPNASFNYRWSVVTGGVEVASSNTAGISFTPPDQGNYRVFLSVSDNSGNMVAADPARITVRNVAPTAAGLTNDGGKLPGETLRVSLVKPTDAAGDLGSLVYDFDTDGDGNYDVIGSTNAYADTTFGAEGFYTLKGRVRDKDGAASAEYLSDALIANGGGGNGLVVTTRYVVAGSDASLPGPVRSASLVKVFDLDGTQRYSMRPFGNGYSGGVHVATGDVDGDHIQDIIVGQASGGSALKIYNGANGSEMFSFPAVYSALFTSGIFVASGDFNRDGYADYVLAPGSGQAVPVVGFSGFDNTALFSIDPFGAAFKGGITVAAADLNGDRRTDLVVGQLNGGSQVKEYLYTDAGLSGNAFRAFTALTSKYKGGVFVAAGDLDGDHLAEVIVGSNTSIGLDSRVRVFSGANGALVRDFVPFTGYRMGVRIAAVDFDGQGKTDIVMGPSRSSVLLGGNPRVIGVTGQTLRGRFQQELIDYAFRGGVFVG